MRGAIGPHENVALVIVLNNKSIFDRPRPTVRYKRKRTRLRGNDAIGSHESGMRGSEMRGSLEIDQGVQSMRDWRVKENYKQMKTVRSDYERGLEMCL